MTYKAILTVDNQEMLLRPGMTATADINVESVKDTLMTSMRRCVTRRPPPAPSLGLQPQPYVPPAASVRFWRDAAEDRYSRGSHAVVLRDGKPVSVQVQTGPTDGRNTVVRSGEIKEGDPLITEATMGWQVRRS